MSTLLATKNLKVSIEDKTIIHDVSLSIESGQVHAIMGPNGSGKSSLALTLMGHPRYAVDAGSMTLLGEELTDLSPEKRAKLGMFLAMQHPYEIEGIPFKSFLRQAYNALYDGTDKQLRIRDFHKHLMEKVELLEMESSFIDRSVNVGFSGGEKKRAEMLQLAVLQPKIALLDEIDSGLDIDALQVVCKALQKVREDNPSMSVLLITHYQRILSYLKPDVVHIMQDGLLVKSGGIEIAENLEKHGYEQQA